MKVIKNVIPTFFIGLVAGVCPFLFMQLLPALLHPSQQVVEPNYFAVVITGILVGAIGSIIFAKAFDQMDPKDVFFYTLGIPAILVATVSNISTKFEAATAQTAASNAILNASPPPGQSPPVKELVEPTKPTQGGLVSPNRAWAEEKTGGTVAVVAQAGSYLVVLGKYASEAQAWKAVNELRQRKLKTEFYIPKNLRVFQAGANLYYVSYSALISKEEAMRIYQLIRINDPSIAPEILEMAKR